MKRRKNRQKGTIGNLRNRNHCLCAFSYKYCSWILALFSSHHTRACISPNLSRLQHKPHCEKINVNFIVTLTAAVLAQLGLVQWHQSRESMVMATMPIKQEYIVGSTRLTHCTTWKVSQMGAAHPCIVCQTTIFDCSNTWHSGHNAAAYPHHAVRVTPGKSSS